MEALRRTIYVTYLEKEGPYLKVWGQTDRNLPIAIEKALQQATPEFEQGRFASTENLQVGLLCCAKFKDGSYYRARITNTGYLSQGMVEVLFIDYGNRDMISCTSIRTMSSLSVHLISTPPQAKDFILAGVSMPTWDINLFEAIGVELRYLEFEILPVAEIRPYILIQLIINQRDVSVHLVNRGLVTSVPLQTQQLTLQQFVSQNVGRYPAQQHSPPIMQMHPGRMAQMPLAQSQSTEQPTLLSYKVMPLESGSEYDVYVSYVSDGPCLFSVQLQKLEELLKRLMAEINSIDLVPMEEYPLPGTVCLAQSKEDGYICRAVVTSMVDGQYKVFYVDFGNTEILQFDKLFQIPFKYVIPKVMATRFALAGLEAASISIEMKCAFKEFVNNKLLHMRVLPAAAKTALHLCELWDDRGVKAIDVLRESALLSYPEPLTLTRGFSQDVKVSFVYSCNKFYVQLKCKENELLQLMNVLQEVCESSRPLDRIQLKEGTPCYALFPNDNVWYRGQISQILDETTVKVRYVDYGNEGYVLPDCLREPISDHIFMLRPQAIECCLNGYQNFDANEQRDMLLEELIFEKEFNMKVVEFQGHRALVELVDSARYNVASLLLDKIAIATSQASPVLIQDNHQIEHRKRSPPESFHKRPLREKNERNDNDNWRQNSTRNSEPKMQTNCGKRLDNQRKFSRTNQSWDHNRQESVEKTDSYPRNTSRGNDAASSHSSNGSVERNMYPRGPKRFDGPKRHNTEENRKGDWNSGKAGNRDNFPKRGRNDDQRTKKHFEHREGSDSYQRQPRGPDNRRNDEQPWRNNKFDDKGDKGFGDSYRQKRRDFKKEPSEKSWSDHSEKSSKKNFKSKYNGEGKAFTRSVSTVEVPARDSAENWGGTLDTTDINSSRSQVGLTIQENLIFAENSDKFGTPDILAQTEDVAVSWFYTPSNFYVQLEKYNDQFKSMMEEIQVRYKKRDKANPVVGAPVIAVFSEDDVLYRAEVISCHLDKCQVKYVDYGNIAMVNRIYPIETKYMELPRRAIPCGLQGIEAPNNTWKEPDLYTKFFDKPSFSCTFASLIDDKFCVDLHDKDGNLAILLLEESLAVKSCSETFCIDLLVGQQVLVLLREVVSLNDIKIELEPNLVVNAAMHNLEQATETYEEDLKKWNGHFIIMFVDNIIGEKLEITIYNLEGYKLEVVVPDEGAYDTVDPLCALPVYTKTIHGFVCHATSTAVYIQPTKFQHYLTHLLEALHTHCNAVILEEPLNPEIDSLYAVHSIDGNWYRGRVIEINEKKVVVSYLDYGNLETALNTDLKPLNPEFFQPHMLVIQVTLGEGCEEYLSTHIAVSVEWDDSGWVGTIVGNEQEMEPTQNDIDENPENAVNDFDEKQENKELETVQNQDLEDFQSKNQIVKAENNEQKLQDQIEEIEKEHIQDQEIEEEQIQNQEIIPEDQGHSYKVSVTLSHADSPSEFYLQMTDALDSISALQSELQEQIPNLPNLENSTPGILCAAPYSVEGEWYRAQILDADDDITTVRFVDYGNTDVIDNKSTLIKTLPSELLAIEYHARLCSLHVKPLSSEWSTTAMEKFQSFIGEKNLQAEIIRQDEKTTFVELFADSKSVAEYLKNETLATDLEIETEPTSTGFICHMNSPSEFWMHLESSVPDLEWVADQLANADTFPVLEDSTPGSLCAAVFPGDESWYRARILSNTVAGLEVIFIDYGNSCSCNGLRELPEDLVMSPPLAMKCSLQKPNGILQWASQATENFRDISAEGATVFDVNVLTPGESAVVQLTLNGEDISNKLLPETKDCFVSVIDSLDSFWVQYVENMENLNEIASNFIDADTWPEMENPKENDLCLALFDCDGVWYRAKILKKTDDGFKVFFIDYGNEAIVSNIRQLALDCDKAEPFCANFKLDTLPRTKWADDAPDKFYELIAVEDTVFQIEIVSENTARLYLNGEDIRTILGTVKCSPVNSVQNSPRKSIQSPENPNTTITDTSVPDTKPCEKFLNTQNISMLNKELKSLREFDVNDEKIREDNVATEEVPDMHCIASKVEVIPEVETSIEEDATSQGEVTSNNIETEETSLSDSSKLEFSQTPTKILSSTETTLSTIESTTSSSSPLKTMPSTLKLSPSKTATSPKVNTPPEKKSLLSNVETLTPIMEATPSTIRTPSIKKVNPVKLSTLTAETTPKIESNSSELVITSVQIKNISPEKETTSTKMEPSPEMETSSKLEGETSPGIVRPKMKTTSLKVDTATSRTGSPARSISPTVEPSLTPLIMETGSPSSRTGSSTKSISPDVETTLPVIGNMSLSVETPTSRTGSPTNSVSLSTLTSPIIETQPPEVETCTEMVESEAKLKNEDITVMESEVINPNIAESTKSDIGDTIHSPVKDTSGN